ncbi:expressed unknown protein [Seminavis robusta]|uniref:Uncharacterized protein n=1 Tax=Seminavis robusta TaxID=568900 RepID=A0A9N8HC64_9STRA|nr:expressed unknown protein [Seminavis robusta]|eukprot:Sro393_g133620.1 n/a (418) ;mRNA; r:32797-34050
MRWHRGSHAIVLVLAICSTFAQMQEYRDYKVNSGQAKQGISDLDRGEETSESVRRELGFFVSRGNARVSRGSGQARGPSLPNINRSRDPLEEGMWTRKRVDMIRSSSGARPTVAPVVTSSPTPSATTPTTDGDSDSTGGSSAPATAEPGSTAAPGSTPAPTGATTSSTNTTTTPATTTPTTATNGTTTAPGNTTTMNPTVAATAPDPLQAVRRSYQYAMMKPRGGHVPCIGGTQDLRFAVDIQVNFPNHRFMACSGGQFQAVTTVVQATLNSAFPSTIPSWPDRVEFKKFEFDVNQFSLHVNPYPGDSNQRHLIRSNQNFTYEQVDQSYQNYTYQQVEDGRGRKLQDQGGCPRKPTVCEDTTDLCIYGCGLASITKCGDLSLWEDLGSSLSSSLSALHLDCLGGSQPTVAEVFVFSP